MKPKLMMFAIGILLPSFSLWAQGGNSGSQSSGSSTPSASQGSATIENQMIAYEVLRQMAIKIAGETSIVVCGLPVSPATSKQCPGDSKGAVLLADPTAMTEIVTTKSFDTSVAALCAAYQPSPSPCGELGEAPVRAEAFADTTTAISGLLTAIKNSAAYSNQNFQPTAQSMINLLSREMNKLNIVLRTTATPGDLDGAMKDIQKAFSTLSKAQSASPAAVRGDVDKEFSAFRTSLTGSGPDGTLMATILKGKALLRSLQNSKNGYWVLAVSVDAAGGDTRIKHWFWQELIMPTPKPTYSGGAVVSYMLTDKNGNWQAGDMLHYMYDFSHLKSKTIPSTFSAVPPQ